MKTKKFISAFLALAMVLSMPVCAYADVTQTVSAGFGEGQEQHITVNDNVSVINEVNAVFVEAHAPDAFEDKNASAEVKGNVTAKSDSAFSAVYVEGRNGNAYAKITGNLVATVISDANVNGVETWGRSYNGTGYAYVNIDGDLTANSNAETRGIRNDCGDVSVLGDLTANGANAMGVDNSGECNIYIGKSIKATGTDDACGAYFCLTEDDGKQFLTVENDVDATCTSDSVYSEADALRFYAYSGKTYVNVKGNVIAASDVGTASGLRFYSAGSSGYSFPDLSPAYFDVKVGDSIISDDYGIAKCNDAGSADVFVENEIQAKKTAVLLRDDTSLYEQVTDGSAYSANQLNLTAWKLNVNERGNVAELITENSSEATPARNFEKKINYIIKAQQPAEYGTISFVDASGSPLKKVNNCFVANEGEKVVVKPNLTSGYRIAAAYNGVGEKFPLMQDESGNYYLIVPKGGGIIISVDVEKAPETVPTVIPTTVPVKKKANPLKIKGRKVTLKLSKVAKKTQTVSVKKAIKFLKKGKGTVTYKKIKGNKKIIVNKKTGKITVKKGLKKGTYKVKVQVTAKGNKNYKKGVKKTTVKIVIA